nr:hypothetical protein [Tanacetum cinerariifolium]
GNGGNRNGENGNGRNRNGRNENPNENGRGDRPVARECTYHDFMKCQPLNFKGTEGVVGLTRMVPEEEDRIERYVRGLPNNIQGNTLKTKEGWRSIRETNVGSSHHSRGQMLEDIVARAYTTGNNERIPYNELPLCNKCKLHHEGPCTVRCGKCNKVGQGHFRSDCPKLKDQNHGSKDGNKNGVGDARGKAYVMGEGDANPDSNFIKGTFLLNNHYAFILFDSGTDRSFMSSTFSTLLDIILDTLDVSYVVELADGRVSETNTMLRGCTLGLLGHPFNIDLMSVELGSFDVLIGMDWLANHHAMIVNDEKIVQIPYGYEVLIVQGDRGGKGEKSKLSIISCTKTQKYIKRGVQFLGHVIDGEGIHVDPTKYESIKDWVSPKTPIEIR